MEPNNQEIKPVQPETSTQTIEPPKLKNNSFLIISLSVLLLLATSLAFFFALQTQKLAKQLAQFQIQPTPTPTATPDPTANWKTYTSDEFGFELKIPLEWKFEQVTDAAGKPVPSYQAGPKDRSEKQDYTLNLFIYDNPQKLTSKQFVDDLIKRNNGRPGPQTYESREEITLNGITATKLSGVFAVDRSEDEIFVANNKYIYQFNFPVASENPNVLDPIHNNVIVNQILSIFRFTD